ncbi:unnamed protein product [Rhizoctonia solani]|uniref:Uncharacterized protein n=1 Tax=Rhizoctonia solani TaxID=456999 RepID=A0A8H3B1J2_9AGAM|nr:unnamed protein product [Rhizoctonia solani]
MSVASAGLLPLPVLLVARLLLPASPRALLRSTGTNDVTIQAENNGVGVIRAYLVGVDEATDREEALSGSEKTGRVKFGCGLEENFGMDFGLSSVK